MSVVSDSLPRAEAFQPSLRPAVSGRTVAILVFLSYLAFSVCLQWIAGGFDAEFAGHPDEPSHYVTGLMVRDYVASGLPRSPMAFAENYYLHYPKVALGHWPPFFYLVEAAWMIPFGVSTASVMVLMAVITSLLGMTVFVVLRQSYGAWPAWAAGLLMLSLPSVQRTGQQLMGDQLVALLVFLATLAFARYTETESWKDSALFGLLAAAAIMTKGTGLALAAVPPFALVLSRRWRLPARFSFWLPLLMVLVLCGPWYLFAPGAKGEATIPLGGVVSPAYRSAGSLLSITTLTGQLWGRLVGNTLLPLVALGAVVTIVAIRRSRPGSVPFLAAWSLILSTVLIRFVAPAFVFETRYAIALVPAMFILLAAGVAWLMSRRILAGLSGPVRVLMIAVPLCVLGALNLRALPRRVHLGYSEIASAILSRPDLRNAVFLVSSDSRGEGALIAEMAMNENRPGHIILRASKMLAYGGWGGRRQRLKMETPGQVMDLLASIPVGAIIIDRGRRQVYGYDGILQMTLDAYPDRLQKILSYPPQGQQSAAGREIAVYKQLGVEGKKTGPIEVDLKSRIGRFVTNKKDSK